jgi:O-acetyl-ADP-ribose deacetylase (regulator of RNase III)
MQMNVRIVVGDVLDEPADVLISTANPQLNLSGGVNGAILRRGGEAVQEELHAHLKRLGRPQVNPGTVVVTGPGPLRFQHIIHAVAIDAFYGSSVELVAETIVRALTAAGELGARSVAMPALATGYGPLEIQEFGDALRLALSRCDNPCDSLTVVVRKQEYFEALECSR